MPALQPVVAAPPVRLIAGAGDPGSRRFISATLSPISVVRPPRALRKIPAGQTRTYAQVAASIGKASDATPKAFHT